MQAIASFRLSCAGLLFAGVMPAAGDSLAAYVANLKGSIPRSGSNAFVVPAPDDRAKFVECIQALLGADPKAARACLDSVNYTLTALTDGGRTYWIAAERTDKFKGQGTYIVNPEYDRNLVLETPHPLFDSGTLEQAGEVMRKVGARALFVPGTHRCANLETAAGCDGRTNACGGQSYRISDSAHFAGNFFTAAHEATLRLDPKPIVLSVHGSAAEPVDAELSNGTPVPAPADAFVNRLRNALEKRGVKAGSCNWPADDPKRFRLCGGTNVQGRMSNGSPNPCTVPAKSASGLFVHIEQMRVVRANPEFLAGAIEDVLPGRARR